MAVRDSQTILVLCAGLHSSGSTWLFNATADLLRSAVTDFPDSLDPPVPEAAVAQLFAESVDAFPEFAELPQYLVVKTHLVAKSLHFLARFAAGPILIALREPRDSVASLMSRFDMPFNEALTAVSSAAKGAVSLSRVGTPLILRYEDRFFEREDTIATLANFLGITVSAETTAGICQSLSPEAVKTKIEELLNRGVFGSEANQDRYDSVTHWHPRHVGQGKTGIFHEVLSARQQAIVIISTQEFCRRFDYPAELPAVFSPKLLNKERPYLIGEQVLFNKRDESSKYLSKGWSKVNAKKTWAIGEFSEIILDLGELPPLPNEYELRITLSPLKTQALVAHRVSVILNSVPLGERLIVRTTTLQFRVPRTLLESQQPTVITLKYPDAARQSELSSDDPDSRLIAVALQSFEIRAD